MMVELVAELHLSCGPQLRPSEAIAKSSVLKEAVPHALMSAHCRHTPLWQRGSVSLPLSMTGRHVAHKKKELMRLILAKTTACFVLTR